MLWLIVCLVCAVQLSSSHTLSCTCSLCAGFVSAVAATPADVVKSRVMNQAYKNRRYLMLRVVCASHSSST